MTTGTTPDAPMAKEGPGLSESDLATLKTFKGSVIRITRNFTPRPIKLTKSTLKLAKKYQGEQGKAQQLVTFDDEIPTEPMDPIYRVEPQYFYSKLLSLSHKECKILAKRIIEHILGRESTGDREERDVIIFTIRLAYEVVVGKES